MVLKEQELLQIDEQFIRKLLDKDPEALAGLSIKLANDLKEARERLNQNPSNSSKPSGSLAPWDKGSINEDDEEPIIDERDALGLKEQTSGVDEVSDMATEETDENNLQSEGSEQQRKPGRQPGSQGFGRTQKLEVTDIKHHSCDCCSVCKEDLTIIEKAYTGFQTVNIEFGHTDLPGVQLSNTQHIYYTGLCPSCGVSAAQDPQLFAAD